MDGEESIDSIEYNASQYHVPRVDTIHCLNVIENEQEESIWKKKCQSEDATYVGKCFQIQNEDSKAIEEEWFFCVYQQ